MQCINCSQYPGCPQVVSNGGGCDIDGSDDFGCGSPLPDFDSIPDYDEDDYEGYSPTTPYYPRTA